MKLAGKKALITGGNSGIGLAQPAFSSLKALKSQLRVAIKRHWMKRSPNSDRNRTSIVLT
jgi:Dehydrogenases with different specificities (related to short-chain alcohol dehydrogenases)